MTELGLNVTLGLNFVKTRKMKLDETICGKEEIK